MEKRTLGRTGLEVTVLGHGAMEIRGPRIWGGRSVTDAEAERILNAVLDAGINFIDTAWDYGLSEQYIGKYISGRRDEYILATKCGCTWVDCGDHDDTPHVWTRETLLANIDSSLERMKTDYVDIWQLHNAEPAQVQEGDLLSVMEAVKASGKARHISISSTLPHIPTYLEWGVFDSYQIPYSALERRHEDAIRLVAEAGAGVIVRGGVAGGQPTEGARRDTWEKAGLDDLREDGESTMAFLLRYTISHPSMNTTIAGTVNPEHLQQNVDAAERGPLSAEVYAEAKTRLDSIGETAELM
ncbi:MAG: aldo/keto reductase [Verrucomicrobia bacterium]|nr:aldo/keto reductase [Verrucomicrobiota bacterium]